MTQATTMQAAVYHPGNNNLVIEQIPIPNPGAKDVLLKVAAAGVCHTDVTLLSEAQVDNRTYVLGHETVGYAVKFGKDVRNIIEGQLYAVHAIVPCVAGATQPAVFESLGIGFNGGFAEYILANESQLIPVPDGLKPEVAALAADSLITAYNAVHNIAQLRPGTKKRVLIYGCGGLGHQAVQIARSYGATVFVCDYKPAARTLALELGAERAFTLADLTAATAAGTFTVDIVIDFVANQQSFTLDKAVVRGDSLNFNNPAGIIVLVGFNYDTLTISSGELEGNHTHLLTTLYGSKNDLRACLELLATGVVKPVITLEPLEKANKVLDELRASEVTGRKVLIPGLKD